MTGVRTSGFELWYLPYGWERPEGNPCHLDGCSNLPISVFWKETLKLWLNTESRPDWWNVRMDASWCNLKLLDIEEVRTGIHVVWTDDALVWWASGRYDMLSRRLVLWTAGRPNGMTRSPDGWQGTKFSDLQTVQNLLETHMNSGIPVKEHHYKEVILSNRMRPISN